MYPLSLSLKSLERQHWSINQESELYSKLSVYFGWQVGLIGESCRRNNALLLTLRAWFTQCHDHLRIMNLTALPHSDVYDLYLYIHCIRDPQ